MTQNKLITTSISYLNGKPHIGHAYEIILADVLNRHYKSIDNNSLVVFQTGTDEHGQKIADKATEMNIKPIDLCNVNLVEFKNLYSSLGINEDIFIRTTSEIHNQTVKFVFKKLIEKGDIEMDTYDGYYCKREEKYIPNNVAQLTDFKDSVSGVPYDRLKEDSYFFRMSRYQDRLIKFYQENPSFIKSDQYRNQILSRLNEPLKDLSVSRTKFDWGINVDNGHVCYVWFDALLNYLSGIDYFGLGDNEKKFDQTLIENAYHIIGKDILWFHGVIYPILLMALDLPLPKELIIHGFITDKDGQKMSKSLGNVVDPSDILEKYDKDVIRFYLLSTNNPENDTKFNESKIIEVNNTVLANNIGNLVNRLTNLIQKGYDGKIPDFANDKENDGLELLKILDNSFVNTICQAYDNRRLLDVSQEIIRLFTELNTWLQNQAPWKLKENPIKKQQIIRIGIDRLYSISHSLVPIMPSIANKIENIIGQKFLTLKDLESFNHFALKSNEKINFSKTVLFQKIE